MAVTIRQPTPRICRHPCIAAAGISPISIGEWVPVRAYIVWLPKITITFNVIVLAVIIQITCAVLVGRSRIKPLRRGIAAEFAVALLAPLVQIVGFRALIQRIVASVAGIEHKGFILLHGDDASAFRIAYAD